MENRASSHWKFFVDQFIFYQDVFENTGNLASILELPYPLYKDIILAQVKQKEKERNETQKIINNVIKNRGKK